MLASAVAAAWSTYLYWLPCRGTMLEGTLLQPFSGDGRTYEEYEKLDPAVKASMDACLRRMDGDISEQAPWTSELLVLAMALVGLAWLTLVFCLRWQLKTKAVAALPGLVTVVIALVVAMTIGDAERGEDHAFLTMLLVAVEWSAFLALAVIWVLQPEVRTRGRFLRIVVALWGTTAFGMYHQMLAYMIMVGFSERDWDEPPGTGVPHGRSHHDLRHPACDHDPTHATEGCRRGAASGRILRVGHPRLSDGSIRSIWAGFPPVCGHPAGRHSVPLHRAAITMSVSASACAPASGEPTDDDLAWLEFDETAGQPRF
jgi:hypothetical protein